jgi:DNA-binding response OmpR family regulator
VRVLIVDDETSLADVLGVFVRRLGHQPVLAANAEVALTVVRRDPPDVILLDVMLPGMSGLDFLRLPAIKNSGVPIVAISGAVSEAQAREAMALGAVDFFAKPVDLERLADVLGFIAPLASGRAPALEPDRRPARRAQVNLHLRLSHRHATWSGVCRNLSASGMKARSEQPIRKGLAVRLSFGLPDSGPTIDVAALAVRLDQDGVAFWFLDLMSADAQRIDRLVSGAPPTGP